MEVEEVESRSARVVHRTGKTCLRLRQLLRFHALSRLVLAVVHKLHLCLPVRRRLQQAPSTFQPLRLLLRSAQRDGYQYPQMCQPRRLMLMPSQQSSWSAASQSARTSRASRIRGKLPPASPSSASSVRPLATSTSTRTSKPTRAIPLVTSLRRVSLLLSYGLSSYQYR